MSKKTWIIFTAVCLAVLTGLVYFSSANKINVDGINGTQVLGATAQSGDIGDQVYGKSNSKVVFVEYGDFQCPGCSAAYSPIKDVVETYKDKIAFVFREFPLTTIHPNAKAAAAAAEAAGLQGKFWSMHDRLYDTQSSWQELSTNDRTNYFVDLAKQIGLDTNRFKTDLDNAKIGQKIAYDTALGKQAGVTGTPTFYLNGKDLGDTIKTDTGAIDKTKLSDAIDAALKTAK